MNDVPPTSSRYLVSQNGDITGPFDLDMIEAFILSGHYPKSVQICAEGSNQWRSHSPTVEVPHVARPDAATPAPVTPKPSGGIATWKIVLGALVGLWILAAIFGAGRTTTPAKSISYTPVATRRSAIYSPPPYSPLAAVSSPANVLYAGADGHTYSVPHGDYVRLSRQKEALDQEDAVVSEAQARLKVEQTSLERQSAYLDRTNQYEVDDFNRKIDTLNTKKSRAGRQIATFNDHVNSFNAELARVGTLVR